MKFEANVHFQTLSLQWLTMSMSVELSINEHPVFLIAPILTQRTQFIFDSEFEKEILRKMPVETQKLFSLWDSIKLDNFDDIGEIGVNSSGTSGRFVKRKFKVWLPNRVFSCCYE